MRKNMQGEHMKKVILLSIAGIMLSGLMACNKQRSSESSSIPTVTSLAEKEEALAQAKQKGDEQLAKQLRAELDQEYILWGKTIEKNVALANAIDEGDIVKVKELLTAGADVNAEGTNINNSWLPLTRAIENGNNEIARLLLKAGANVNATEKDGRTALIQACYEENEEMVKRLLKAKANVNMVDIHGETALMKAAWKGNKNIVKQLLKAGADVNIVAEDGDTALLKACLLGVKTPYGNLEADANNSENVVALLINAGANVNAADEEGWTPLMFSSSSESVIKQLLAAGADANAQNKNGRTILMNLAADSYAPETAAQLLLDAGADVNIKDEDGYTALDLAMQESWKQRDISPRMLEILIDAGANIRKGDELSVFSVIGDIDKVKQLLAAGANINVQDHEGKTALIRAIQGKHKELVEFLVKSGADVNIKDKKGYPALKYVEDSEMKKLLLGAGAIKDYSLVSCKGINTSGVNKKMLKKVLSTINDMKKIVLQDWNPNVFADFGFGHDAPYRDLFYYDNPYSNPSGMGIRVEHKDGGENLVIYGPKPEMLFHQCVMPVGEDATAAFCCAVHELDSKYEVRQYALSFP